MNCFTNCFTTVLQKQKDERIATAKEILQDNKEAEKAVEHINKLSSSSEPDRSSTTTLASIFWTLYYQAKFKLFLLKNKITLSDIQAELITTDVDQPGVEIKWTKIKHNDKYKEIDFQRYSQLDTNIVDSLLD